jgi:hypothetical protein
LWFLSTFLDDCLRLQEHYGDQFLELGPASAAAAAQKGFIEGGGIIGRNLTSCLPLLAMGIRLFLTDCL